MSHCCCCPNEQSYTGFASIYVPHALLFLGICQPRQARTMNAVLLAERVPRSASERALKMKGKKSKVRVYALAFCHGVFRSILSSPLFHAALMFTCFTHRQRAVERMRTSLVRRIRAEEEEFHPQRWARCHQSPPAPDRSRLSAPTVVAESVPIKVVVALPVRVLRRVALPSRRRVAVRV
jgi:hypothetical protein